MTTPRLATLARVLQPALMVLAAVLVAVFMVLGLRLNTELRTFQEEPVDNIHWNVTQLELDAVRVATEAELMRLQPDQPLAKLRKFYDLFYSRAQSAMQGKMFDEPALRDEMEPMNLRIGAFLAATTPLIDADDATLRAELPRIVQDATALRADLRIMSVRIVDRYAALADQRRAAFAGLVRQVAWVGAILFVALILMNALILWLNRLAEARAVETARLSSRLAATVDTSLDAIIVVGQDGRVIDFNAAAAQIFGYSVHEAMGAELATLIIPPAQRGGHDRGMARMHRDGTFKVVNSGRIEMTAMRKGGAEFPVELSIASHDTPDGMIFISYLRDISGRIAASDALRAARDNALAAEQAKTNFMAVMSHEMRTPLNGVMAALEIAGGLAIDPKQQRFLGLAQSSARQLLRHANDVLDIAKVEAGQMQLTLDDIDLVAVLQDITTTLDQLAQDKGTALTLIPLGTLPPVHADAFRIGQIVQNFLSNAIKFTEAGSITLEVEVVEQSGPALTIEIRVIDTGIGIAEADQDRVFDDFVMVDPSYGRTGGGAGLGLAISRRLAHAMGGEVGVESEPGQGSCFWLRLPVTAASSIPPQTLPTPAAPTPAAPTPAAPPPAAPPSAPLNVLVVEDNATNRIVLQEMLTILGHAVTLANDGGRGMELARARHFDVILMDISMPLMDGVTATMLIRLEGASTSSRILAVTAHSLPADLDRFRDAGMDGCLTKPISVKDLQAALCAAPPPPALPPSDNILDTTRLNDLRVALGPQGLSRIITRYLADSDLHQSRLTKALTAPDPGTLIPLCHEAAGAAAMIGAAALHAQFARAEALCRDGDLDAATRVVTGELQPLWQATCAALTPYQLPPT